MKSSKEGVAWIAGVTAMAVTIVAIFAWRVSVALNDNDIRLLIGGGSVLFVFWVAGRLMIAHQEATARVVNRALQQDDEDEARMAAAWMAFATKMRSPALTFRSPGQTVRLDDYQAGMLPPPGLPQQAPPPGPAFIEAVPSGNQGEPPQS